MNKEQVIEEVVSKLNNVSDGKIVREVKPFLGGTLWVVGFKDNDSGGYLENYAFYKNGNLRVFRYDYELYQGIANEGPPSNFFQTIIKESGIEGSIAIILTGTICYLAIIGQSIPELLGSALTAILGFYFGSKVSRSDGAKG